MLWMWQQHEQDCVMCDFFTDLSLERRLLLLLHDTCFACVSSQRCSAVVPVYCVSWHELCLCVFTAVQCCCSCAPCVLTRALLVCLHSGAVLLFLCTVCLDTSFACVSSQRCSAVVPVYCVSWHELCLCVFTVVQCCCSCVSCVSYCRLHIACVGHCSPLLSDDITVQCRHSSVRKLVA